MRRTISGLPVVLIVLGLAGIAAAQPRIVTTPRTRTSGSNSSAGVCYVVVEKEGLDLYVGLYGTTQQTKERIALVKYDNARRKRTNAAVDAAVKELRSGIAAKKRAIAKAEKEKDEAAKAMLLKEIAAIEEQITEKRKGRVLLVKVIGPKTFRSRKAAENYMEAMYDKADKANEKAEDKKRAAAKRQKEADDK